MKRSLILSLLFHAFLATLLLHRISSPDAFENQGAGQRIQARLTEAVRASNQLVTEGATMERVGKSVDPHQVNKNERPAAPHSSIDYAAPKTETSADGGKVASEQISATKREELASTQSATQSPVSSSVSLDGVRQYRLNLAREARNYKRFPALARQRGWEGEVSVVVGSVAGTALPQVTLNQGSGIEVLDRAALEMVRLAVQSASMPDSLRGQEFALTLPIRFALED